MNLKYIKNHLLLYSLIILSKLATLDRSDSFSASSSKKVLLFMNPLELAFSLETFSLSISNCVFRDSFSTFNSDISKINFSVKRVSASLKWSESFKFSLWNVSNLPLYSDSIFSRDEILSLSNSFSFSSSTFIDLFKILEFPSLWDFAFEAFKALKRRCSNSFFKFSISNLDWDSSIMRVSFSYSICLTFSWRLIKADSSMYPSNSRDLKKNYIVFSWI